MKSITLLGLLLLSGPLFAQQFSRNELSINGFRNPSIGLEYRRSHVSVRAGYYPTRFTPGITTSFIRTGLTYWFLPVGQKANPSSFYASASYVRGMDREYEGKNGLMGEVGFRWMVWKGLNLRIGAAVLTAPGEDLKVNPTPGISYSFFW
ncbi:hypothetical protein [Spirosoma pollinicola]|uniref:DUF3575 domain-containing protein n=1 Tax=Spirosoma pollinicola TaxID=2057025 RepID=A0A2K8YSE6_9BACT|nr:hypothetical protein [Spirosoma pollinicola]AUD00530.1 hypothetical protein CWM47_01065 [Spirosoma pollinicola]